MTIVINGTTGVSGVDGSASTPSYQGTDSNTGIVFPTADTVGVATGGSERMRVDSSGNVGIGTTSPSTYSAKFAVKTAADQDSIQYIGGSSYAMRFGSNANFASIDGVDAATGSSSYQPICLRGSIVLLNTGGSERARITSGGDFLVAKTTTNSTIVGCELRNTGEGVFTTSGDTQTVIGTSNRTGTAGTGVCLFLDSQLTSGTGGSVMAFYNTNAAAYRMFMRPNGNIENTNGTYGTIASERRFKQDIVDVGSQWDDIKNVRLRKFRLKKDVEQFGDDAQVQLGVIIDELEQVCPGLVTESVEYVKQRVPLLDEEGSPVLDENGQPQTEEKMVEVDTIKGWKTSVLHLKAVKALQEAMARIETLEAEVAALKAKE